MRAQFTEDEKLIIKSESIVESMALMRFVDNNSFFETPAPNIIFDCGTKPDKEIEHG
jgi:hypothetical protein